MAYKFRFHALLKYRQYLLTQAQTELAAALKHYQALHTLIERTTADKEQAVISLEAKRQAGIKASEYHLFQDYFLAMEQQLLQLNKELEELARGVADAKELLRQRERELKMLEVTDDKDRAAYRREQAKREQAGLDERSGVSEFKKRSPL